MQYKNNKKWKFQRYDKNENGIIEWHNRSNLL